MAFILVSNHLNMMNFRAIFWGPNVDMSFVFEVVQPQEQCILSKLRQVFQSSESFVPADFHPSIWPEFSRIFAANTSMHDEENPSVTGWRI